MILSMTGDFPFMSSNLPQSYVSDITYRYEGIYTYGTDSANQPAKIGEIQVPEYIQRCKYCGIKYHESEKFCEGCGAPL